MRRIIVSTALALALLAAPTAVSADESTNDPNGVIQSPAVADGPEDPGSTTDPEGSLFAASCEADDCQDIGPTSDPNGLTARSESGPPLGLWLGWLRAFLPV